MQNDYALADDRNKVIENLIPGTEDHYYYRCLQLQHEQKFAEVAAVVEAWVDRYHHTQRVEEILNRQALLTYEQDGEATLKRIRERLGLSFHHQRQVEGRTTNYPTALDPKHVSWERLKDSALSRWNDLGGFTDRALWRVSQEVELDDRRRRHLLERLVRPDVPGLVALVADDLRAEKSGGFGSHAIHRRLLLDQLDALAEAMPKLRQNEVWILTRLQRLLPGPDVDLERDHAERLATLDRLWAFVEPLVPAYNSLKLHVLHHRLQEDRRRGVHDADRLRRYLKLPRQAGYMKPKYLRDKEVRDHIGSLTQDYSAHTGFPVVGDDEPLIREMLAALMVKAPDIQPWETYLRSSWLTRLFATTKILAGVGDMETWYSLLDDPTAYQALKEQVEVNFAPTNPTWFRTDEPVTLAVDVKNVETLVVKVFEVNALNVYLTTGREVDTAIDLDGLVAGSEATHTFSEPDLRRVRREFSFPQLDRPGVFVVELIGNGRSSRALIRKGSLRPLERVGAAGHVFRILDEDDQLLTDASLWFEGRERRADAQGEILIPFTTEPRSQTVLLRHGDLTTRHTFQHQAERYGFDVGVHVDRESLLARREATVVVRANLRVGSQPASVALVEDATLTIESTDRRGTSSSKPIPGFQLHDEQESVHTFQVPDELAQVAFAVRGRIKHISTGKYQDVEVRRTYPLNGIDRHARIDDLHLARTAAGYVVSFLGKTGEPRAHQPVRVGVQHQDFNLTVDHTLQTDERGRVELGPLVGFHTIRASAGQASRTWSIEPDQVTHPRALHGREGEPLRLAYVGAASAVAPDAFALLERQGETYLRDRLSHLARVEGALELRDLPAGDYELVLKERQTTIPVRITKGRALGEWALGASRLLERQGGLPLTLAEPIVDGDALVIRLGNASARTRVHVVGTRFLPGHRLYADLAQVRLPGLSAIRLQPPVSAYVSGRDIGDEYRYILDRRYAEKYPGNTLTRPGLLLNPWAMRKTDTGTQDARGGGDYAAAGAPAPSMAPPKAPAPEQALSGGASESSLDFLPHTAVVLTNLRADEQGVVRVALADLPGVQLVRVLAVDRTNALLRSTPLPEVDLEPKDLRLIVGLDPNEHFTEQKQVTLLAPGQALGVDDITTAKLERYDTLRRVFGLYQTLSDDETLRKFEFVLQWPTLSREDRRSRYSEHACHELNLFLWKKDPTFFTDVIQPYLRNKKDKTFLDRFLLEDDLSAYRRPWAYGQLNVVERILLGRRIAGEHAPTARHVQDLAALIARDIAGRNHRFTTAISTSALGSDDAVTGMIANAAEAQLSLRASGAREKMKEAKVGRARKKRSAPSAKSEISRSMLDMDDECLAEEEGMDLTRGPGGMGGGGPADDFFGESARRDMGLRQEAERFYQKLEMTQELGENNYYHLPLDQQGPELVTASAFWRDYAAHTGDGPFLSQHLADPTRSFTEMMCALAVLDLPFEAQEPQADLSAARLTLTAASPAVVFHREIKPAATSGEAADQVQVLVSQNYHRADDRYRETEDGETVDKFVRDEFLVHTVYRCQVVLTNPTAARYRLDLLLQIPRGAVPVEDGFETRGLHRELHGYSTETFEYAFYFPEAGDYPHFPVHVARDEVLVASAPPLVLNVVDEPSSVDTESWVYISQNGEPEQVFTYLETHNVERLDLTLIAWRMRDRAFYLRALPLLAARHAWDETLWSYAICHDDPDGIREYLLHQESFLQDTGRWLESPLVTIDPCARRWYQHREYAPFVNARAHPLGGERKILNNRLRQQWEQFRAILRYKPRLDPADQLALAYYLLLQDRITDGLTTLARVDRDAIATQLQHDYLSAYAAFFGDDPASAKARIEPHTDHPVDRWRKLFQTVAAQLAEISGAETAVVDEDDRDQAQTRAAAAEPTLELAVEDRQVRITYQNLERVTVRYYLMDIELLFSRQPFVQQQTDQFSWIQPNASQVIDLPAGAEEHTVPLPPEYQSANLIIELSADGIRRPQAYYAHTLRLQLSERFGQLKVAHRTTGAALPRAYVKVYARMKTGQVQFYKDGYTDHRGRFDYTSLSTDDLDRVERFALLVMTDDHGAVIREAAPPKR